MKKALLALFSVSVLFSGCNFDQSTNVNRAPKDEKSADESQDITIPDQPADTDASSDETKE